MAKTTPKTKTPKSKVRRSLKPAEEVSTGGVQTEVKASAVSRSKRTSKKVEASEVSVDGHPSAQLTTNSDADAHPIPTRSNKPTGKKTKATGVQIRKTITKAKKQGDIAATKIVREKRGARADDFADGAEEVQLSSHTGEDLDVAARKATASKKSKKKDTKDPIESGVVYIGRIPHGFFEEQMRGFFSQFGSVLAVKVSRNKKTGKSKHYGFIKFDNPEVAQIVANAMQGFYLSGRTLTAKYVPKEQVHEDMFKGCDKEFEKVDWRGLALQEHNKVRTTEQKVARSKRLLKKERLLRAKLEAQGIEYDFPGLAAQAPVKGKHIRL